MRLLLEAIGENPTEEELTRFMAEVDEGGKGEIEFSEFLRAFEKQRGGQVDPHLLSEIVDSFVALGGNRDKSGAIDPAKLIHTVRDVFGMTLRVEKLVEELDVNKDGRISFDEYLNLFLYSR